MSNKDKIRKLEEDLTLATEMLQHMASMILPATQALQYIAEEGKDKKETNIILLHQFGLPKIDPGDRQPAKEVATECLIIMNSMQMEFNREKKVNGVSLEPIFKRTKKPEQVQLRDGQDIVFTTDFDILYHQCCDCGLIHEVQLEWDLPSEQAYDAGTKMPSLTTKWTQVTDLPDEADIIEAGHAVIKREDLL